jgi:hypothetical protein
MKNAIGLLMLAVVFASCEKVITIEPEIREPLLVVDGSIEDGQPPMILLSKSINYFSSISADIVARSLVRNAQVTLSDGSRTVTLKEYVIPFTPTITYVYYSTDTSISANRMVGEQEKTYTLQVTTEGKTYSATTSIPKLTKTIDSLWWEPSRSREDTMRAILMAKITDPPGFGNYIRYFTKVNREAYKAGENSVYDDQLIDGSVYNVQVEQGRDRNSTEDQRRSFKRGDTVTVKFANIDKSTYDFWRTLEFGYRSVGNPFASPIRVLGNVNNNALGAFSGYSVQYKTFIIPR